MVYFLPLGRGSYSSHGGGSRSLTKGIEDLGGALRYSHLGIQFAISVVLLFYVGYRLDLRWSTTPLFTLLGFALGFAAGFYSLYMGVYGRPKGPPAPPP